MIVWDPSIKITIQMEGMSSGLTLPVPIMPMPLKIWWKICELPLFLKAKTLRLLQKFVQLKNSGSISKVGFTKEVGKQKRKRNSDPGSSKCWIPSMTNTLTTLCQKSSQRSGRRLTMDLTTSDKITHALPVNNQLQFHEKLQGFACKKQMNMFPYFFLTP